MTRSADASRCLYPFERVSIKDARIEYQVVFALI
jgi:hypothetical protein